MRLATTLAFSFLLGLAGPATAGELLYANGSRLAGELGPGVLMVSTGSDLVEVPAEQVGVLTREEVRLKDGRVVRGTLVGGRLRVQTALGELTVEVDELREFRAESPARAVATVPPAPAPAGPAPGTMPPALPPVASPPPAPAAGPADAPSPSPADGPRQVVDGTQQVGRGVEGTAKGVGRTVTDAAVGTAQATKRAADRVHDGFKAFGEAVWEGMKSAGRAFQSAFTGD
jgi:hypothetical protein